MPRKIYKFIFVVFFILFTFSSFCQIEDIKSNGKQVLSELYKISENKFMDQYGLDDTNKVLIHLFYRKRKNGFIKASLFPLSSFMVGLDIFNGIETGNFQLPDDPPVFYPLLAINIHGIYLLNKYNRRTLYQIISDRNSGISLSPSALNLFEKEKFRMESRRSKKEYIECFKSDKNKIALIEYYFKKRSEAQKEMLLLPVSIAMVSSIMAIEIGSQGGDNIQSPISEFLIKFFVPASFGVSIYGMYNSVQYTKKRLYRELI